MPTWSEALAFGMISPDPLPAPNYLTILGRMDVPPVRVTSLKTAIGIDVHLINSIHRMGPDRPLRPNITGFGFSPSADGRPLSLKNKLKPLTDWFLDVQKFARAWVNADRVGGESAVDAATWETLLSGAVRNEPAYLAQTRAAWDKYLSIIVNEEWSEEALRHSNSIPELLQGKLIQIHHWEATCGHVLGCSYAGPARHKRGGCDLLYSRNRSTVSVAATGGHRVCTGGDLFCVRQREHVPGYRLARGDPHLSCRI